MYVSPLIDLMHAAAHIEHHRALHTPLRRWKCVKKRLYTNGNQTSSFVSCSKYTLTKINYCAYCRSIIIQKGHKDFPIKYLYCILLEAIKYPTWTWWLCYENEIYNQDSDLECVLSTEDTSEGEERLMFWGTASDRENGEQMIMIPNKRLWWRAKKFWW